MTKEEFIEALTGGIIGRIELFSRHVRIQGHDDLAQDLNAWLRTFEAWSAQSSPERDLAMEVKAYLQETP